MTNYIVFILFLLTSVNFGCGRVKNTTLSQTRDLATIRGTGVYLYYLEGEWMVRAGCQAGEFFDRSRCTLSKQRAKASPILASAIMKVSDGLEAKQAVRNELYIVIVRIDQRLREFLAVSYPIQEETLRGQLDDLAVDIAAIEGKIAALQDQIVRIDAQLAIRDDGNLRMQRLIVEVQRNKEITARDILKDEMNRATKDFIDQSASLLTDAMYQNLLQQRGEKISRLVALRAEIQKLIEWRAAASRMINMLSDQGLAYDLANTTQAFKQESELIAINLHPAFEAQLNIETREAELSLEKTRRDNYYANAVIPFLHSGSTITSCVPTPDCPALFNLQTISIGDQNATRVRIEMHQPKGLRSRDPAESIRITSELQCHLLNFEYFRNPDPTIMECSGGGGLIGNGSGEPYAPAGPAGSDFHWSRALKITLGHDARTLTLHYSEAYEVTSRWPVTAWCESACSVSSR